MTLGSIALITVLFISLCVSIFYVIKFGLIIIRVQDAIEESLDVLDEKYASIYEITKIPLFYDSPEIRKVLQDISMARDSVLDVAKVLTKIDERIELIDAMSEKEHED